MGIYVLKASAIRDLLSKHFPEVCHSNLVGMQLWCSPIGQATRPSAAPLAALSKLR